MNKLVFLLEEESMATFLDHLIPRIAPRLLWQCLPHQGKSDLLSSIPRKLKGWREPGVKFIVVQDNDNNDCHLTKQKLYDVCPDYRKKDTIIRIVCQELEAWYFGDLAALHKSQLAPANITKHARKAQFRNPDSIVNPSDELRKILPSYQKIRDARRIAPHISIHTNQSSSYRLLVSTIKTFADEFCDEE